MSDRHLSMCHKEMWGGRCDCSPRAKKKPCGCKKPGCTDIPELTAEQLKSAKPFSLRGLRMTYATREVLRVGKMESGEPYFSDSDGGVNAFAMAAFSYNDGNIEESILSSLGCKPGDKVECVVTLRKLPKNKRARGGKR